MLYQSINILKKLNQKKRGDFFEGSTFINDDNMEFLYSGLNDIQDHAKNQNGDLLIL